MRRRCVGLVVWALAGCGEGPPVPPRTDAGAQVIPHFTAVNADFDDYRRWPSFALDGGGQYPRIIYIKARPPPGSTAFPVGTLIVKELLDPLAPGGLGVDAMAKRGGDDNPGAPGWEFLELTPVDGGAVIVWRGTGVSVPVGAYVGGGTSCVGCHAVARDNDFVQSGPLQLH